MESGVWTQDVKDAREYREMPEEYQVAVAKIVRSHAINELVGAQIFDEPSIQWAPSPYEKWLACRIAMEEYGHHVRFARVAADIGIPEAELDPAHNKHLNLFDYEMRHWIDFATIKAIGDLAETIQVEDLETCTYVPLRDVAVRVVKQEELFHTGFGRDRLIEAVQSAEGRATAQDSIDRIFPVVLPFFGRAGSANNAMFRRWGIKRRTNEEMRREYVRRVRDLVEGKLGLSMPPIPEQYREELNGV